MLNLSRRVNEVVLIEICGVQVRVIVTYIHNRARQCGLGFEAPTSVNILRAELIPFQEDAG